MKQLSWEPILRGNVYCSPACGYRCTQAKFKMALQEAIALAVELGDDWKPDVWENMGWHWNVANGGLKVHPSHTDGEFTAFLGEPNSAGGRWAEHGSTPARAVANVLASAKRDRERVNAFIVGVEVNLRKPNRH